MGIFFDKSYERGKGKQMRSLTMMNRIFAINRPAISGFDFPCFDQPQFITAIADQKTYDKNRNRYRYRRK